MPSFASHISRPSERHATTAVLAPAAAILLCAAVLITLIGQYTDLDLVLADLYFDRNQRVFPWNLSLIHISEPTRPY